MGANIRHYLFQCKILLKSRVFPFGKMRLILTYLRLLLNSFVASKQAVKGTKSTSFLGMTIYFESYPILVDQFEEIFLRNQYHFKSTSRSPLIIDAGSNIGMSIIYFKLLYPSAKIIAFEPDHSTFVLLSKMTRTNKFLDVTLNCVALGAIRGTAPLFKNSNVVGDLNMSLIPGSKTDLMSTSVRVERLSAYITDIVSFVKIDTEGSESDILEDLIREDKLQKIEQMTIEFHPTKNRVSVEQFISHLSSQHFELGEHHKSNQDEVLKFLKTSHQL